jgi:predicted SpoU family rRNA methylase
VLLLSQQLATLGKEIAQLNERIEAKRRQQALVTEANQLSSQAFESLKSALAIIPDTTSDLAVVAVDGALAQIFRFDGITYAKKQPATAV